MTERKPKAKSFTYSVHPNWVHLLDDPTDRPAVAPPQPEAPRKQEGAPPMAMTFATLSVVVAAIYLVTHTRLLQELGQPSSFIFSLLLLTGAGVTGWTGGQLASKPGKSAKITAIFAYLLLGGLTVIGSFIGAILFIKGPLVGHGRPFVKRRRARTARPSQHAEWLS